METVKVAVLDLIINLRPPWTISIVTENSQQMVINQWHLLRAWGFVLCQTGRSRLPIKQELSIISIFHETQRKPKPWTYKCNHPLPPLVWILSIFHYPWGPVYRQHKSRKQPRKLYSTHQKILKNQEIWNFLQQSCVIRKYELYSRCSDSMSCLIDS